MAKTLKKSTKKLLSVGFHLILLTGMVLIYDGAKLAGMKFGLIKSDQPVEVVEAEVDEWTLDKGVDPELAKLVDQNEGGYHFKRDIAFPPHLKVISTHRRKFLDVRIVGNTPFGPMEPGQLSYRDVEKMEYEMAGKAVRLTVKKDLVERILLPEEILEKNKEIAALKKEGKPVPPNNDKVVGKLEGKAIQFSKEGRDWKAQKSSQFATAAWGKRLEGNVAGLLVENGLKPRQRWFGEKRMKQGDTLKLNGQTLSLVFDNVREGSLEMVFIGMEGINGHPCGVFEIKGTMVPDDAVNDLNQIEKSEVSIESGKVWLSLLYPVVMRVRVEAIETMDLRQDGKSVFNLQGTVEKDSYLEWGAVVAAKPKAKTPAAAKQ